MESRIQEALQHLENFPDAKIATVAREFGVPRTRLRNRINGVGPKKGLSAKNTRFSNEEEIALCRYIDRLDHINLAVRAEFVTDAANYILHKRFNQTNSPIVGHNWTTRFLRRRGYHKRLQKKLNSDRQVSEDLNRVQQYFNKLQEIIHKEGLPPEDIWNMDETGFRIGVGKDHLIVTKRKRAHYFGIPENRESATAIEAISASGQYIPAFLILSGQLHMAQWYQQQELHGNTVIGTSSTGYSNDQMSLHWIQHFEKHTVKMTISKKRLLILDGHGSHHTREFIQYCDDHNIIAFGMPPNLTHLLQPLDVVVFQPLKHYHSKALDIIIRDGLINITKIEFLSCIQQVRIQAFKQSTILSAFRKTGIHPFNPHPVLQILAARQAQKTPTPPSSSGGPQSSPFNTPLTLRQMNKVANKLDAVLQEDEDLNPEFANNLSRFIRGSLINVTELIQTKRDLQRTKLAEQVQRSRRAMKNTPLQSGGILTIEEGRAMVQQKEINEVARAQKIIEAAELKTHNAHKRWFAEAAKKARKMRLDGRLKPAEIIDTDGGNRFLKRF
jgi:hypothetical protein